MPIQAWLAAACMACACIAVPSVAQQLPARFPRDITLYVGSEPGGGYDLNARTVARHMGRHLPGSPTIQVVHMPGDGGKKLANFLFASAPRDGSAFAIVGPTVLIAPLLGMRDSLFEPQRFTLLGSSANEAATCIASRTAAVQNVDQLRRQDLIVGATGPSAVSGFYPNVLNAVLGTRFVLRPGYDSSSQVLRAMQSGEIEGFCGLGWANLAGRSNLIGRVTVLLQLGAAKHPEHPEVPLAQELTADPANAQLLELFVAPQSFARPFIAPPDMPEDRAAWLRLAFYATFSDDEFLAESAREKLEPELVKADQIRALLNRFYALPNPVLERARTMVQQ